ncbi:MAG: arsenic metallochaperone ArsD family protein [archaeon]|nr:arsenic metallochaperone ArsD family protein [archaeon]
MSLTVYESNDCRKRLCEDRGRFEGSVKALADHGIRLERVLIRCAEDIDPQDEAFEIVSKEGLQVLPVTVYEGACVTKGEYPSDQELADYLDVPDGVLSTNRYSVSAANDMESCCCCCRRN